MSAQNGSTVFAVRENSQVSGIILCGLTKQRILEIQNVFRVKGARRTKKGISYEVNSLVAPARAQWSGSSFLLLVGNPHVGSRGESDIHKLNVKPGDELVTGPNGFYVSVDIKDEECMRGLKVLRDALSRQPLSERVDMRTTQAITKPSKRSYTFYEGMRTLFDLVFSVRYRGAIARSLCDSARRTAVRWFRNADRAVSQTLMLWVESRFRINIIERVENGAPALMFVVERVPRFIPRPVQKSVRTLGQKLGQVLLPASV